MSTTPDLTGLRWVKSSYSGNGGGNCLEVAPDAAAAFGVVPVRDSKVTSGLALVVSEGAWSAFMAMAKDPSALRMPRGLKE